MKPPVRSRYLLLLCVLTVTHPPLGSAVGIKISRWPPWQSPSFSNASASPGDLLKKVEVKLLTTPSSPHAVTLLEGVVALNPTSRLSFPSSCIPPASPAFSVSASVFLTEDSTGKVRTIFSRGANSNQRTPTLALLKHSRRLLFKVTTLFRPEISATSARQLPLLRWAHVTLTSDGYRTLTLFLDGKPDGTLYTDRDVILANGGPFTLGKDHVAEGAAALISGLKVFPYELSRAQIISECREALATLPQFEVLAGREAEARGISRGATEPAWKPQEKIVAESEFVWRGEVAGSPPAADTPPFAEPIAGGLRGSFVKLQKPDKELVAQSRPSGSFSIMARERLCPVSHLFAEAILGEPPLAAERGPQCEGGGSLEAQHFWELILTNAQPIETSFPHPEPRLAGRANSDFVEELARLAIERLSPFRLAARFLRPLLFALEIVAQDDRQQGLEESPATSPLNALKDGLGGAGENGLQHGATGLFHTGSPEGEKAYRGRTAQQQFEAGKAAAEEAIRAEGLDDRLRRVKESLDLLRQAAEGGVDLAHLELAYVMAQHMAELETAGRVDEVAPEFWSQKSGDRGSESELNAAKRGVLDHSAREALDQTDSSKAALGSPVSGAKIGELERGVSEEGLQRGEAPSLRLHGASFSLEGDGQEGAASRSEVPVLPWQERITYHFLRAAAAGSDEAFAALGYRSLFGLGTPRCQESARYFFEKAAEAAVLSWQRPGERVVVEGSLLHGALSRALNERSNRADLLQIMAGRGHRAANLELGRWYLWGVNGMPRDPARAARHLERAHAGGIPHATVGLAKMLMAGEGVAQNASLAREYYEAAAEKGDPEALNGLGYFALHGLGGAERNSSQAVEYFQRAAKLGSQDALVNLGAMQRAGWGTPRDDVAAWRNFWAGAAQGHVPSAHHAAMAASSGHGTERNPGLAAHLYRLMSETGPWAAHLGRGLAAFLDGDARGALASYARAAELGYPPAQYNAAWLLEKRPRDLGLTRGEGRRAAAVYLERIIAEGGPDGEGVRGVRADLRAWAHVRLGDCAYYEGACGGRESAAGHYRAAGELGNGQGQFSLAYLLEQGTHGVACNRSEAERFYRLSGDHPNKGAAAAAALAIAKLRQTLLLEKHGVDLGALYGPIHKWVRNGFVRLLDFVRHLLRLEQGNVDSSLGGKPSGKENGPPSRGARFEEDGTADQGEQASGESANKDAIEGDEQEEASFTIVATVLLLLQEDWVVLGLCLALSFILGFRWARQRAQRAVD